jgi:hypothetical protein
MSGKTTYQELTPHFRIVVELYFVHLSPVRLS